MYEIIVNTAGNFCVLFLGVRKAEVLFKATLTLVTQATENQRHRTWQALRNRDREMEKFGNSGISWLLEERKIMIEQNYYIRG